MQKEMNASAMKRSERMKKVKSKKKKKKEMMMVVVDEYEDKRARMKSVNRQTGQAGFRNGSNSGVGRRKISKDIRLTMTSEAKHLTRSVGARRSHKSIPRTILIKR